MRNLILIAALTVMFCALGLSSPMCCPLKIRLKTIGIVSGPGHGIVGTGIVT